MQDADRPRVRADGYVEVFASRFATGCETAEQLRTVLTATGDTFDSIGCNSRTLADDDWTLRVDCVSTMLHRDIEEFPIDLLVEFETDREVPRIGTMRVLVRSDPDRRTWNHWEVASITGPLRRNWYLTRNACKVAPREEDGTYLAGEFATAYPTEPDRLLGALQRRIESEFKPPADNERDAAKQRLMLERLQPTVTRDGPRLTVEYNYTDIRGQTVYRENRRRTVFWVEPMTQGKGALLVGRSSVIGEFDENKRERLALLAWSMYTQLTTWKGPPQAEEEGEPDGGR